MILPARLTCLTYFQEEAVSHETAAPTRRGSNNNMPLQTSAVHCGFCLFGHTQAVPGKKARHGWEVCTKMTMQLNRMHVWSENPGSFSTSPLYGPISWIQGSFSTQALWKQSEKTMVGIQCMPSIKSHQHSTHEPTGGISYSDPDTWQGSKGEHNRSPCSRQEMSDRLFPDTAMWGTLLTMPCPIPLRELTWRPSRG